MKLEIDVRMPIARRIVVIDCQAAGISGDMILGALLDLGADSKEIDEAMKYVKGSLKGCKSLELLVREVTRKGFRAKKVDVKADEEVLLRTGRELKDALADSLNNLKLSSDAVRLAVDTLNTLINTEAKLHGEGADEVHLHEAGSVDTLAEIVGAVVALENLSLLKDTTVYSSPVAVGGGLFAFSHGTVSTPAPATLEILRSNAFPMVGGPVDSELATPTGVSLLTNLTHTVSSFYPPMKPTVIGYGAGMQDYAETPNLLRIVVGEPFNQILALDEVHVLETNLDDVSGEVIGHAVDRLLEEGARDVSIIPMFTKKNRPGQILKVISDAKNVQRLAYVLVEETGALGVREYPCRRHILTREVSYLDITIDETIRSVRVKVARDLKGNIIQVKPEHVDIERLARETAKPYRLLMEMIARKARRQLEKEA